MADEANRPIPKKKTQKDQVLKVDGTIPSSMHQERAIRLIQARAATSFDIFTLPFFLWEQPAITILDVLLRGAHFLRAFIGLNFDHSVSPYTSMTVFIGVIILAIIRNGWIGTGRTMGWFILTHRPPPR
jgi:hypothetical protein